LRNQCFCGIAERSGRSFQPLTLPHLTALQNITLPLEKVRLLQPEAEQIARQLMGRFRLENHANNVRPNCPAANGGWPLPGRWPSNRAVALRRTNFCPRPGNDGRCADAIKELREKGAILFS
jgi:hypothetical protein